MTYRSSIFCTNINTEILSESRSRLNGTFNRNGFLTLVFLVLFALFAGASATFAQDFGQKLLSDDWQDDDGYGYQVSIDGNYAIVGSPGDDTNGNNAGAAYIYFNDGNSWTEQEKIVSNDIAADDGFGFDVAISGDYAIISALYDDDIGLNAQCTSLSEMA